MPANALLLDIYVSYAVKSKIVIDLGLTFSQTFRDEKAKSKNPEI